MWYSLILSYSFSEIICCFQDGFIYNSSGHLTVTERVNVGDLWEMEVDLRSEEKEKRTLHWFVRGKQQKGFIKGVPDKVQFGV